MRVEQHHLIEEALTYSVIGAFYEVYNAFRYGLLERLYMNALELELRARGHRVTRELRVDVMYKGKLVGRQKLDMVVDDKVVIEGKSTFDVDKSALRQLYSYLRATNLEVGLLLHFGPEAKFYRLVSSNIKDPTLTTGVSARSAESA